MPFGFPLAFLLLGLQLLAFAVFAAGNVLDASQPHDTPVSLTQYFAVLEDARGALTLDDVQKPEVAARFKNASSSEEALAFGYGPSAYWLRLQLDNSGNSPIERILEISYALLTRVEFHQQLTDGTFQTIETGNAAPFATRAYKNRFFVFPVRLPERAGQTIYLRVQSADAVLIPARLWSPQAFHEHVRNDYLGQAWYFGIATAMALFNLLLFFAIRDRIYLLYVGFVVCASLALAAQNGIAQEFLWPDSPYWSGVSTIVGFSIAVAAMLAFMRQMLNTGQVFPRIDGLIKLMAGVFLIVAAGCLVSHQTLAQLTNALFLVATVLIVAVGLLGIFKRQRSAYFFVAAFALLMLGSALGVLRAFGLLPSNVITANGVQIGSALEMILLAIALADRFNQIRQEKAKGQMELMRSQAEAMEAQRVLVEALRSSERELEDRVKQRTAALDNKEKEALQSLTTIQSILDTAPVGISVLDAKLRHTHVNQKYLQIINCSAEDVLGHTHQRFFDSMEDFESFIERISQSVSIGKTYGEERRNMRSDGSTVWVRIQINAIDSRDFSRGFVVAIEDISDRKRSEQETLKANQALEAALLDLQVTQDVLIQSARRTQLILDAAPIGIYLMDERARITQFNKKFMQFSGASNDDLLGHTPQRFFPSYAEFQAYVQRSAQALRSGQTYVEEREMIQQGGALHWVRTQVAAVDSADERQGMVATVEDISERKRSEQEIKASHDQLAITLENLRTAQAQLIQAEKMASLGQLVANVAHEINTPIGAIKSSGATITESLDSSLVNLPRLFEIVDPQSRALFAQLVSRVREIREPLSTREERAIRQEIEQTLAREGVAHAKYLAQMLVQMGIHDSIEPYLPLLRHPECDFILTTAASIGLLATGARNIHTAVDRVSRIVATLRSFTQDGSAGRMVATKLQDSIDGVLASYQNQCKQGVEVVRDYEDLPPVPCLEDELPQVWAHLIHNALQAMRYKGTLTINLRQIGHDAVVSVSDTGCGIPDEILGRIFEPFFTTRPAGEGAGLGLEIVRKIVDKHGGRVEVRSEVGVGSTFSVYLPISGSR